MKARRYAATIEWGKMESAAVRASARVIVSKNEIELEDLGGLLNNKYFLEEIQ